MGAVAMYLFSRVSWQIENQHREERDPDAWNDQVDGVEKRFSSQRDVEGYICRVKRLIVPNKRQYICGIMLGL
jgi:hypothetical protein